LSTLATSSADFRPRLGYRRMIARVFVVVCILFSLVAVLVLGTLIARVWIDGADLLGIDLLRRMPNPADPLAGGVANALWGTIWLMVLTIVISTPVGVAAAIYLEEYAKRNRITNFIQLNISNLAGVPSIVYGILGLAVFVRWMRGGQSLLAGALTMSVLILPVIIIASREALAAVPSSIRLAAYALGATRWQTIRHHVLPAALPGIMTGLILAFSRAIGESAPLVMIGALAFTQEYPDSIWDRFTVLPLVIFHCCDSFDSDQHKIAAATILVLLAVLFTLNGVAIGLRAWHQRNKAW
jgi:phosphate transport system permease protein